MPAPTRLAAALVAAALLVTTLVASATQSSPASAAGATTRFVLPGGSSSLPTQIVTATDGAFWIIESGTGRLIRMSADGRMNHIGIEGDIAPDSITPGPNGSVYWTGGGSGYWGVAKSDGSTLRWSLQRGGVAKSIAMADGERPWITVEGATRGWLVTRDPLTAYQENYSPSVGGGTPTAMSMVKGRLWVSFRSAGAVYVIEPADRIVKRIDIPNPGVVRDGDGGVFIASGSKLVKFTYDGVPTGLEYPGTSGASITDVVAIGQDIWYPQFGAKKITVASRIPGRPAIADITLTDDPSDITLGQDGAIWYTSYSTGEVVRIARDYVPATPGDTSDVLAYVGEPLGPIDVDDDGAADVSSVVGNNVLPAGMSVDSGNPSRVVGTPSATLNGLFVVQQANKYYGDDYALSSYTRNLFVREKPSVQRVAGADRYATAVAVSTFYASSDTVYLASGEKFADALSAGPGAIADRAPLLLTPGAALPSAVGDEILRLQAKRVVVVGGPASVSDAVVTALGALGGGGITVERVSGADRYEASRNVVARINRASASSPLFIAAGGNFPDALSGAPAAAARDGSLLLVDGAASALPDVTLNLIASKGYTAVTIAGGPASVSAGIESQLAARGIAVNRVSGSNRYETSIALNRYTLTRAGFVAHVADNPVPLEPRGQVFVASGESFPDALAAGAFAGVWKTPLYVVQRTCAPRPALLDIGSTGSTFVAIFGGTSTLGAEVESLAVCR